MTSLHCQPCRCLSWILALFILGGHCEADVPLSFYIISEAKIEGGRFVDTKELPKVGYIAAKADLVIDRLAAVTRDVQIVGEGKTALKEGETPEVEWTEQPALMIEMMGGDAQKFTALTQKALGKRLLMMLGDKALMAPYVHVPIPAEGFKLSWGQQSDSKEIEAALKRLVK